MSRAATACVMRPVEREDLEGIYQLSCKGGNTLTTLPADREFLEKRIRRSMHAFYPEVSEPGGETYTFTIESMEDHALIGISGTEARTGGFDPFYTYKRVTEHNRYEPLAIDQMIERLECETWHKGPSELGSLYLQPDARGGGVGRLASFGRLLFMVGFSERFEDAVIAEIRGWQDASGKSPFWEGVIRPFFGTAFEKMDAVSGSGNKEFIGALLPKYPIYCSLLPEAIRSVIGKPHTLAAPAMKMLLEAGFEMTDFIDVFDAGPMISASLSQIGSVAKIHAVRSIEPWSTVGFEAASAKPVGILFKQSLDFRAVLVLERPNRDGVVHVDPRVFEAMSGESTGSFYFYDFV